MGMRVSEGDGEEEISRRQGGCAGGFQRKWKMKKQKQKIH